MTNGEAANDVIIVKKLLTKQNTKENWKKEDLHLN